jgi:hypothetical protein
MSGRGGLDVARAGPHGEPKTGDSRELGTAIDTAPLPSQVPVDPTHHQPEQPEQPEQREQRWAPPPAPHAPVQPHGDRGGTEHVCVGWPQLGSFDGHVALGWPGHVGQVRKTTKTTKEGVEIRRT